MTKAQTIQQLVDLGIYSYAQIEERCDIPKTLLTRYLKGQRPMPEARADKIINLFRDTANRINKIIDDGSTSNH